MDNKSYDPHTSTESVYYHHSGRIPLASRLSYHVRRKMFNAFMEWYRPTPQTAVLDVGVTSDDSFQESNFFERFYPWPHKITCVGTEDGSYLAKKYPGLSFQRIEPGCPLPFADQAFDVVFSNAVLEHTGSHISQRQFLDELRRVGKAFFVTTPNRWFPVEHHTGLPLLHYLPTTVYRAVLRRTPYRYWADENHLNILTVNTTRQLFPPSAPIVAKSVRLYGIPSNIIVYGPPRVEASVNPLSG
jgi:SAM-dependent methyltransferase